MLKSFISLLAFTAQALCFNRIADVFEHNQLQAELNFHQLVTDILLNGEELSLLLIKQSQPHYICPAQKLLENSPIAVVQQSLEEEEVLSKYFNRNILAIVCLEGNFNVVNILKPLLKTLLHKRDTKTVIYIDRKWLEDHRLFLNKLLRFCFDNKLSNVLVVFEDFHSNSAFFSYRPFPQFSLKRHQINADVQFFPDRYANLYGQSIMTLPDQYEPRTILTTDKHGRQTLKGYVGKFMRTLAWKLNGTLQYPFPIRSGNPLYYNDLIEFTRNSTLDIPASILPLLGKSDLHNYSYPFEFTRICLMIPLASDLSLKDVYLRIMSIRSCSVALTALYAFAFLITMRTYQLERRNPISEYRVNPIDLVLNDVSLRGVLGQPFKTFIRPCFKLKFIFVLLFATGLYLSVIFQAHLQTMLTQPPRERQISTFADAYRAHLNVLAADQDIAYFNSINFGSKRMRVIAQPFWQFRRERHQLNTAYAYPVPNLLWEVYEQQQRFFARQLFIYSEEACLLGTAYLSFVLQDHSVYRKSLDKLILEVRAHGLIDHWFHFNFYDMVTAGSVSFTDLSNPKVYGGPLQFEDLQWIWIIFVVLLALSLLIFVCELLYALVKCKLPIK